MTDHDKDPALQRAYALDGPQAVRDLYSDWAGSYEADTVGRFGYVAPRIASQHFVDHFESLEVADRTQPVIDVGCGTGLVGTALAEAGFSAIDGLDLSPDMLTEAHGKGVYRALFEGDLTARLALPDDTYAGAISVGTFTHGHVGPEGLSEVLRVVRPGGLVTLTVNEGVYDSEGYADALDRLATDGRATVLGNHHTDYLVNEGIGAFVVTLRVGA